MSPWQITSLSLPCRRRHAAPTATARSPTRSMLNPPFGYPLAHERALGPTCYMRHTFCFYLSVRHHLKPSSLPTCLPLPAKPPYSSSDHTPKQLLFTFRRAMLRSDVFNLRVGPPPSYIGSLSLPPPHVHMSLGSLVPAIYLPHTPVEARVAVAAG